MADGETPANAAPAPAPTPAPVAVDPPAPTIAAAPQPPNIRQAESKPEAKVETTKVQGWTNAKEKDIFQAKTRRKKEMRPVKLDGWKARYYAQVPPADTELVKKLVKAAAPPEVDEVLVRGRGGALEAGLLRSFDHLGGSSNTAGFFVGPLEAYEKEFNDRAGKPSHEKHVHGVKYVPRAGDAAAAAGGTVPVMPFESSVAICLDSVKAKSVAPFIDDKYQTENGYPSAGLHQHHRAPQMRRECELDAESSRRGGDESLLEGGCETPSITEKPQRNGAGARSSKRSGGFPKTPARSTGRGSEVSLARSTGRGSEVSLGTSGARSESFYNHRGGMRRFATESEVSCVTSSWAGESYFLGGPRPGKDVPSPCYTSSVMGKTSSGWVTSLRT